jgi:hypothetical protein
VAVIFVNYALVARVTVSTAVDAKRNDLANLAVITAHVDPAKVDRHVCALDRGIAQVA